MQPLLLAIDAGTGSGRAVIFDTEGNQLGVGKKNGITFLSRAWPTPCNLIALIIGN